MSIGTRIAELRKKNNFSQEYVAAKIDVSRQAVSKWEQNLSKPDTGNLIKIAELFGVSVEYLATGKADTPALAEQTAKQRLKLMKKHIICIVAALVVCLIIGVIVRIYTLPWIGMQGLTAVGMQRISSTNTAMSWCKVP